MQQNPNEMNKQIVLQFPKFSLNRYDIDQVGNTKIINNFPEFRTQKNDQKPLAEHRMSYSTFIH